MATSFFVNAMQVDFEPVLTMEHTGMTKMFMSLKDTELKGVSEGIRKLALTKEVFSEALEDKTGASNRETFMESRHESTQPTQQSMTYTGKSVYALVEIQEINCVTHFLPKMTQLIKARDFYTILIDRIKSRSTTC
ncbi:putative galacturonosyltransferase 4 [Dorcoceras hygrometricum]|uniref:Putative galacturonosyltransferase 4 n=1 Tax=Dorcoceras hygrometricum TaxID=472368 RepID=A0A2Z7D637_9LAMI|nr:putative galacturonosyltransferase 4 [Dorcoceras hygrometricum]